MKMVCFVLKWEIQFNYRCNILMVFILEKLKKAAVESLHQTTDLMMDSINSDVAFIFSNQVSKEW